MGKRFLINDLPSTGELYTKMYKHKTANKTDGIFALAMATLQAIPNRDTGSFDYTIPFFILS